MGFFTLVCVLFLAQVSLVGADQDNPRVHQRAAIQFLVSLGMSNANIFRHLLTSFGAAAVYSRSTVNRWACHFQGGHNSVKFLPKSGRPPKLTAAKLVEIQGHLRTDKTLSIRELARRVQLSVSTIHKAVRKNLQLRRRPAKWVAHLLTPAQKQLCVNICRQNLVLTRRRPNMMSSIVSGDESWISAYDPASKRSTSVWLSPGEERPQKVQQERATIKVMLVLFFDANGIILKRFVPYEHGIDADLYATIMHQLWNAVRHR